MTNGFHAYQVAIELVRALRPLLVTLRTHDRNLADQARRAATSVPLNVAEGRRRVGGDRLQLFRVALGSTAEIGAALDVALAWGYLAEDAIASALVLLDRERALLWRLTHGREG